MAIYLDASRARKHLLEKDRKLGKVIESVGPVRLKGPIQKGSYEALVRSILYQQLAGAAARVIFERFCKLFGSTQVPSARKIVAADETFIRSAGLSRAKARYVQAVANAKLEGVIPTESKIQKLSDEEIIERLTEISGVGIWTVQMLLIFQLGRADVLPTGDYGVQKGFSKVYGKKELPKPKDLAKFGERWRPYRSVASWYLWRSLE